MYIRIASGGISNIQGQIIFVEVDISNGLPYFAMVGLLSSEVKESGERVRSAIRNSGYFVNPGRITISLTPGNIRKEGTGYDLAIAMGILISSKAIDISNIDTKSLEKTIIVGELGLDGSVKKINGVLPILLKAKSEGYTSCIIPYDNSKESHMIEGMRVYAVRDLKETVKAVMGSLQCYENNSNKYFDKEYVCEIDNIFGNEYAKRALLVSVCGMHNILFMGPPGAGKTMLARSISSIMSEPDMDEKIDIASIYSVCGLLKDELINIRRPFRNPHHSITLKAFTGGGSYPKPGEMTLAHRGVLFLDELPEFRSEVLESLREPLEEKYINIVRNKNSCKFPADFLLVGAMNNCKCGYYPDRNICRCSENDIRRYVNKIHGPLIDRIDICINILRVESKDIGNIYDKSKNVDYKKIVNDVQRIQRDRFKSESIKYNSQMDNNMVNKYCGMTKTANKLIKEVYDKMNLSVRSYYKIIKVARTIADMDGEDMINDIHLAEAIGYKNDIIERG